MANDISLNGFTLAQLLKPAGVQVREGPLSLLDPRVNCALDGTGDEAAKVATAISLLPATGGHIYQPPGILRTSAISFDRPVRWEGAGTAASTIKAASGFTGALVTITSDAPHSHISNVQVAGGGSAAQLIVVASARTLLSHLYLTATGAGTNGAAIYFNGVSSSASAHAAQVSNVRILSCAGYGVFLKGFAYDNEFSNLWIGDCVVGVRSENTNTFYSNLHVWGCSSSGVELRSGVEQFVNAYIETNAGSGFNLFNAPRVRISNSNIWKNTLHGILATSSDRLQVSNCLIYDNGTNGVNGVDSLHGHVTDCQFYDDTSSSNSQDRPVVTTGTSDRAVIALNTMMTADHAVGGNSLVGANNVVVNNVT